MAHSRRPFTCPECGAVSHNRNDRQHGYCSRCHDYTDEPEAEMDIDGKTYSFTQPVCTQDWVEANHEESSDGLKIREPVRANDDKPWVERLENCCKCGALTTSQIFIRVDPSTVPYPTPESED